MLPGSGLGGPLTPGASSNSGVPPPSPLPARYCSCPAPYSTLSPSRAVAHTPTKSTAAISAFSLSQSPNNSSPSSGPTGQLLAGLTNHLLDKQNFAAAAATHNGRSAGAVLAMVYWGIGRVTVGCTVMGISHFEHVTNLHGILKLHLHKDPYDVETKRIFSAVCIRQVTCQNRGRGK